MAESMKEVLAWRLPSLLKESGRTQEELAAYCGVSQNTVSCWSRGLKAPRPEKMRKLAEFFNIRATDLLSVYLDTDLRPVRFLPLIQPDGTVVDSSVADSYGSLASGIDADFVWVCPDDQMSGADVRRGDVCLIKASKAIRTGHPALIVLDGVTRLAFLQSFECGLYIGTGCPARQGAFIAGDWKERARILGYLKALRREWKR